MARKTKRSAPSEPVAKRSQAAETVVRRTETRVEYKGPLPPPHILKAYDIIQPGFAERIVSMAEKQAEHRQGLERIVIHGDTKRAWWGLGLGFVVAMAFLYVCYLLIMAGHEWAGGIIGTIDLGGLVATFVIGNRQRQRERNEKARIMAHGQDRTSAT